MINFKNKVDQPCFFTHIMKAKKIIILPTQLQQNKGILTRRSIGVRNMAWYSLVTVMAMTLLSLLSLFIGHSVSAQSPGDSPSPGILTGYDVSSPDGSIVTTIDVVDGRLTYEIVRDKNTTVVAPSGLGFVLKDPQVDLTRGLEITSVERDEIDETWTPVWGTTSEVRNHANELTIHTEHSETGIKIDLIVRVFDDGVGFRYHFPQQEALGDVFIVTQESTEFALPPDMTAYFLYSGTDWNADERHYMTKPLSGVTNAQTPITVSRDDGLFVSVHEANLTDFPSMTLLGSGDVEGMLVSDLVALPNGDKAIVKLKDEGFSTPWRTLIIGRSAGDLAESHLIENLNDPCAICNVDSDGDGVEDTVDWIEPGTYTGVWWELQRRDTTWEAGPNHGATTDRIKDYIDLAEEAGAKYVLAEGWNINSGGSWANQDFLTPRDDVDLEEVLDYAEEKGVGFIAHNETRGNVDYYDRHMEEIFARYEEWGIHAIKTGYATKFILDGVNRSHYDQRAVQHYQRVIETAAKHKISINAHEAIKPTGLSRTYPNMMTGEGVAGMEQHNYKGSEGNPPEQATILPFTRWIGGPADYTPGVLNVTWDPAGLNTRVQTTTTTQLALNVTFYSPLQMLADTPENYAKHSEAFKFLKGIPTTWDESHVLDAVIGDYTVTTRRSGTNWYLGAITDENDRTLQIPLDFLESGTTYVAEIYSDAADASWKGNPTSVEVTKVLVDSDDTLSASMVAAGGMAVKFREATEQDMMNLQNYEAPSFSLLGQLEVFYNPSEDTVTVNGEMRNEGSTVGEAVVYIDGEPLEGDKTRVAAGEEKSFSFIVPADSVSYSRSNDLALGNSTGPTGSVSTVSLLPYPDTSLLDMVDDLTAAGELDPATSDLISKRFDEVLKQAEAGEYDAVRREMQAVRFITLTDHEPSASALDKIDEAIDPFLGEETGLFAILAKINDVQLDGELDPVTASKLRRAAGAATRQAILGDEEAKDAALDSLEAHLEEEKGNYDVAKSLLASAQTLRTKIIIEAEESNLTGGARVIAEHPGYTGDGFVRDLTRMDAGIKFETEILSAMEFDAAVRYANGMSNGPPDRQLSLSINGNRATKLTLPNLGQNEWSRWGYVTIPKMTLEQGLNEFHLFYGEGDTGHVNVDHLRLIPYLGVLNDNSLDRRIVSAASMKILVECLEEEGEFANNSAARSLQVHLIAVDRFEKQEAAEKIIKHMENFKLLLEHQKENALISEVAYYILKDNVDYLIDKWQ